MNKECNKLFKILLSNEIIKMLKQYIKVLNVFVFLGVY